MFTFKTAQVLPGKTRPFSYYHCKYGTASPAHPPHMQSLLQHTRQATRQTKKAQLLHDTVEWLSIMLRYDRNLLPVDWGLHESKFAPTINQRPGITRIRGVSRYLRPVPLFKPKRFTITLSCVVALKWGRVFHASDLQYECQGNTNRWRETRLLDKRHTPSTPNYISYLFKRMITGIKKREK